MHTPAYQMGRDCRVAGHDITSNSFSKMAWDNVVRNIGRRAAPPMETWNHWQAQWNKGFLDMEHEMCCHFSGPIRPPSEKETAEMMMHNMYLGEFVQPLAIGGEPPKPQAVVESRLEPKDTFPELIWDKPK